LLLDYVDAMVMRPSPGTAQSLMSKSWQSDTSRPPPPTAMLRRAQTPGRSEKGALVTDPTPGLDTVYDGAHEMNSMAAAVAPKRRDGCGNSGRPYSQYWSGRNYSSSFNSKSPGVMRVPAPGAPYRTAYEKSIVPLYGDSGGPQYYNPFGSQSFSDASHSLSGSIHWVSRGHNGPIGSPIDSLRCSSSFSSQVPRGHFTAVEPPRRRGINQSSEAGMSFVLKSDFRQQARLQSDFHSNMQRQWVGGNRPGLQSAPGL